MEGLSVRKEKQLKLKRRAVFNAYYEIKSIKKGLRKLGDVCGFQMHQIQHGIHRLEMSVLNDMTTLEVTQHLS